MANQDYELRIDGTSLRGRTDANGRLEQRVPITATDGTLRASGYCQSLKIGALEPLHTTKGVQGRLLNLGFAPGPVDGVIGPRTIGAIRAFQYTCGLTEDGVVGEKTRAELRKRYGS